MQTQLVIQKESICKSKFNQVYGVQMNNKPISGGFWTSTLNTEGSSGWVKFAEINDFYDGKYDLQEIYIETKNENVYTVDSKEDFEFLLKEYELKEKNALMGGKMLDLEKLSSVFDGLRLTLNGLYENKFSFYGWDVESTLWFNIDKFKIIRVKAYEKLS